MKKVWLYVILFLVLTISSLYIYIKSVVDSIEFDFNISGLNLSKLSLDALKNSGSSYAVVKIELIVRFFGLFNISFSDLNLKTYYKGRPLASSVNSVDNSKKITLINEVKNKFYHFFNVQVNMNTIDLINKINDDKAYEIDYEISFKIKGLTIKYKNKYEKCMVNTSDNSGS